MKRIYWLASFPKSGNTWFRIFLKNYLSDDDKPFDINHSLKNDFLASLRELIDKVTGLESSLMTHEEIERLQPAVYAQWSLEATEDRYVKIHDACNEVLPDLPIVSVKGTKGAIYIMRNPLDVVLSFADHMGYGIDKAIEVMKDENSFLCGKKGKPENQVKQRLNGWSGHVASWADARWFPVEIIKYEEMKEDPLTAFGRAIRFLELPYDEARLKKAVFFSEFNELKKQEQEKDFIERSWASGAFFRKGEVGQWKVALTPEQIRRIVNDHAAVMKRFGYLDGIDPELLKEIDR